MTSPLQPFDEFVSRHIKTDRPKRLLRMHNYDIAGDIDRCKELCETILEEDAPPAEDTWEARRKLQEASK